MRILNLYAGVGGQSMHWDNHEVVAVEYDPKIAAIYAENHPSHTVIVGDALEYLLENFQDFDWVWASPPCPANSRMIRGGKNRKPRLPDLTLYEIKLFLDHNFSGLYCIENVIPYYKPLTQPSGKIGRHLFWSNFDISGVETVAQPSNFINKANLAGMREMQGWLGMSWPGKPVYAGESHCPAQIWRNALHPSVGKQLLKKAEDAL